MEDTVIHMYQEEEMFAVKVTECLPFPISAQILMMFCLKQIIILFVPNSQTVMWLTTSI